MPMITRRSLLASTAALGATATFGLRAAPRAFAAEPQQLHIPELIDARQRGNGISLKAQTGWTAFFPNLESVTRGFNGSYLGPTLRLHRGDEIEMAVTNGMRDRTAVHWHGLLLPAEADGGPHQMIQPGATWRPQVKVDQPAATLWYHAHVHHDTARQVYSGLAGMILIADDAEQALGLPSDYGVNDIPLILQDKLFEHEQLAYPNHPMVAMHGLRGDTFLVNGTPNAVARVPAGLARLRLLNASNARVFDLSFSDGRLFHWIATDAALLEKPVERRSLWLAPGERAEVLVDFSDRRGVALRTNPDPTLGMGMMGMMGMMGGMRVMAEPLGGAAEILHFEPHGSGTAPRPIPRHLVAQERLDPGKAVRRRRLVLTMGPGMMGRGDRTSGITGRGMRPGGTGGMMEMFGINGRPYDMERIDQAVRLGDTEIWEVTGEMMAHPFHMHGVHFEVLSRAGSQPTISDRGLKDTVLVQEPVELLVRFTQPAATFPFVYHCHTLEHEDRGMMSQFKTV